MKINATFSRLVLAFSASASFAIGGQPIPNTTLFNTGVDNDRIPLPDNSVDLHYTFVGPVPTGTAPIVATSAGGFPIAPAGPRLPDSLTSAWITPSEDTTGNAGDYTYRTTFTVPTGVDLTQAFVRAMVSSDNNITAIRINGIDTGITWAGGFSSFSPSFGIGSGIVAGVNTIDFVVNEASGGAGSGGYTGLRVELNGGYGPAGHVAIPGLVNTGVTAREGPALADDAVDTHYTMSGAVTGSPIVARASGGFPIPPWAGDSRDSAWITPAPDTNGPAGDYFYDLVFDMTGLDLLSAAIFGQWAVDDLGVDILLNGVPTGNSNTNGFGGFTNFSISADEGDVFLPGLNTLRFVVNNGGGPGGMRVEFLSATAAPVPEPSTAILGLAGLGALLLRRRRG